MVKPNATAASGRVLNTADWDIQDHASQAGPFYQLGAIGAEPPGQGIVEGNQIPYLPEASHATKKANSRGPLQARPGDQVLHARRPASYLRPVSLSDHPIAERHSCRLRKFASTNRLINMGKAEEAVTDTWMGTSNGHWEGDTLVVDVTGFNVRMAWAF